MSRDRSGGRCVPHGRTRDTGIAVTLRPKRPRTVLDSAERGRHKAGADCPATALSRARGLTGIVPRAFAYPAVVIGFVIF